MPKLNTAQVSPIQCILCNQAEIVSGASGVFIPMSVWKVTHTDDKLASGGRLH